MRLAFRPPRVTLVRGRPAQAAESPNVARPFLQPARLTTSGASLVTASWAEQLTRARFGSIVTDFTLCASMSSRLCFAVFGATPQVFVWLV